MLAQELIQKKKMGLSLSQQELSSFFLGYLNEKSVTEYQVSAMLMAICFQGMEYDELMNFTQLLKNSGHVFKWDFPLNTVVDKHSTGGIGDKTSLIILPLAILSGLKVPMIAGRGLGHTGGTLDKLEAIGINVFLTPEQIKTQMTQLGGVWMGQTAEMVPLDRKLYAMRDVTATVESIPLIVASILSKKLAEGLGGLVMDVKYGNGAFLPEVEKAQELASNLASVGKACGVDVRCVLSSMHSPLGGFAGNALEVYECVEILKGKIKNNTLQLSLELCAQMLDIAFPKNSHDEHLESLQAMIDDGSAFTKFSEIVEVQGGNISYVNDSASLLCAKVKKPLLAAKSGFVSEIDVRKLGYIILELGGGRRKITDTINPWVGLGSLPRVGDYFEQGAVLAEVFAQDHQDANLALQDLGAAINLSEDESSIPNALRALILE